MGEPASSEQVERITDRMMTLHEEARAFNMASAFGSVDKTHYMAREQAIADCLRILDEEGVVP